MDDEAVQIPRQLLQRILHEFMASKKTRISEPALEAMGEYIKIFIQEAVHRAAAKKKQELKSSQDYTRVGSLFLEVCDDPLSAQMVMY